MTNPITLTEEQRKDLAETITANVMGSFARVLLDEADRAKITARNLTDRAARTGNLFVRADLVGQATGLLAMQRRLEAQAVEYFRLSNKKA